MSYEGVLMVDRQARHVQTNTCEFRKAVNLVYGQGGLKLEINIPPSIFYAPISGMPYLQYLGLDGG